jgi:hypothetical protein
MRLIPRKLLKLGVIIFCVGIAKEGHYFLEKGNNVEKRSFLNL